MKDGVGDRYLKVYESISSYWSINYQPRKIYGRCYWRYWVRFPWGKGREEKESDGGIRQEEEESEAWEEEGGKG